MEKTIIVGRIKNGASISQDMGFGKWPACKPPRSEYENEDWKEVTKYPDALFYMTWTGRCWDCRRDGYGAMKSKGIEGEYGNGSIFVHDKEGIEIIGTNAKPLTQQTEVE